jgi:hypothetical protein
MRLKTLSLLNEQGNCESGFIGELCNQYDCSTGGADDPVCTEPDFNCNDNDIKRLCPKKCFNCATATVCFNDGSLNPLTGVCQCKLGFKGKVVLVVF